VAEEHDGPASGLGEMDGNAVRLDGAMGDLGHGAASSDPNIDLHRFDDGSNMVAALDVLVLVEPHEGTGAGNSTPLRLVSAPQTKAKDP
jgi:hypothetical protein